MGNTGATLNLKQESDETIVFEEKEPKGEVMFTKFFINKQFAEENWMREIVGTHLANSMTDIEKYFYKITSFGFAKNKTGVGFYRGATKKTIGDKSFWTQAKKVNGEPLSEWLKKQGKVSESIIKKFAFQLIFIIAKCHITYGLQHDDLHEGNIMVGEVKVDETLYFEIDTEDYFKIELTEGDLKLVLIDFGSSSVNVGNNNFSTTWRIPSGVCLQRNKAIEYALSGDKNGRFIMKPESEMFTIGHILMSMSAHNRWDTYTYTDYTGPHMFKYYDDNSIFTQVKKNLPKGTTTNGSFSDSNVDKTNFGGLGTDILSKNTQDYYIRMKLLKEEVFNDKNDEFVPVEIFDATNKKSVQEPISDIDLFKGIKFNLSQYNLAKDGFKGLREALVEAGTYEIIRKLMKFNSVERANFGLKTTENNYCLLLPLYHHYFGDFVEQTKTDSVSYMVIPKFLKPASYNSNFDRNLTSEERKIESEILKVKGDDSGAKKAAEEAKKKTQPLSIVPSPSPLSEEEKKKTLKECKKFLLDQMDYRHALNADFFYVDGDPQGVLKGANKCIDYIRNNIDNIRDENVKNYIIESKLTSKAALELDPTSFVYGYENLGPNEENVFYWLDNAANAAILAVGLYCVETNDPNYTKGVIEDIFIDIALPDSEYEEVHDLVHEILYERLPEVVREFLTTTSDAKEEAAKKAVDVKAKKLEEAQKTKEKIIAAVKEAKDIAHKALKEATNAKNLTSEVLNKATILSDNPSIVYEDIIKQAEATKENADNLDTTITSATNAANTAEKKLKDVETLVAKFPDIKIDDIKTTVTDAKRIAKEATAELTNAKRLTNEKKTKTEEEEAKKSKPISKTDDKDILAKCKNFIKDQMSPQHAKNKKYFYTKDDITVINGANLCLKYIKDHIQIITNDDIKNYIKKKKLTSEAVLEPDANNFEYKHASLGPNREDVFLWLNMAANAAYLAIGLHCVDKNTYTSVKDVENIFNIIDAGSTLKSVDKQIEEIFFTRLPQNIRTFLIISNDTDDIKNDYKLKLREFVDYVKKGLFQPASLNKQTPIFVDRKNLYTKKFKEKDVKNKMTEINTFYNKIFLNDTKEKQNIQNIFSEQLGLYFDAENSPKIYGDKGFFIEPENEPKIIMINMLKWVYIVHLRALKNLKSANELKILGQLFKIDVANTSSIILEGIELLEAALK